MGVRGDERAVVEHDRPDLAREHVRRLQMDQGRLACRRRARRVLERERLAGAVDDEEPPTLGERREIVGRVHVDVSRERTRHLISRVIVGNDVAVLRRGLADQQDHRDAVAFRRGTVDGGSNRDRVGIAWLEAHICRE